MTDYRTIVAAERELAARTVLSIRAAADDLESLGLFNAAGLLRAASARIADETGVE